MGDRQHTQNIQINKVIGENEKCLLFYSKNHRRSGQPKIFLKFKTWNLLCGECSLKNHCSKCINLYHHFYIQKI